MIKFDEIKKFLAKKFLSTKSFKELYNIGVDAYAKQNYQTAITYFKAAVERSDAKPQAYYNLALSYQREKDYDRAIVTYSKFLAVYPDDYDGLYNLGLTYYQKENYEKAIEFFEKCVLIKNDEDGIKSLVICYLNQDEPQKAVDFSQQIFELPNVGTDLYYSIAKVVENKNSFNKDFKYIDMAIGMYQKIVEKDPKYFNAYLSISICYAKKGEWEQSVEYCKKAIEANPKSYEANNQMGLVFYCREEVKEAVKYYEQALNLKPDGDFKIYSNLGYAYEKIGQYDKAVKIFSQLVSKFPKCPAKDEIKNHLRILKSM